MNYDNCSKKTLCVTSGNSQCIDPRCPLFNRGLNIQPALREKLDKMNHFTNLIMLVEYDKN